MHILEEFRMKTRRYNVGKMINELLVTQVGGLASVYFLNVYGLPARMK